MPPRKKKILISSAWFLPPRELLEELIAAARRGVSVRIITPLQTDREGYDGFRALPIPKLIRAGGEWYGLPQYFHQKYFLFDDAWCFGSANCDILSLNRNYELVVCGRGGEVLAELENDAALLLADRVPRTSHPTPAIFRHLYRISYAFLEFWFSAGWNPFLRAYYSNARKNSILTE